MALPGESDRGVAAARKPILPGAAFVAYAGLGNVNDERTNT